MKTKVILLVLGIMVSASIIATAQSADESRVKLLNTAKPGVIKMIHAISTDAPVSVKFMNSNGVFAEDKIKGEFPKGVSRRYNLISRFDKDFRMEITSENLKLTYRIVPSKDKQSFASYLEKVEHRYDELASLR